MPSTSLNPLRLLAAGLLGAAIVCAGTVAYLARGLPQNPGQGQQFAAADFNFVMGSGTTNGDRVLIDGFADGYALMSSGPVKIEADRYRFLRITIDRRGNEEIPHFFWRRSEAPEDLVQIRVREEGPALIDLSAESKWRGEIAEFGFLLRGDGNGTLVLGPVRLEPDRLALRLEQVWDSWTMFERWTQRSINFLSGGAPEQPVRLPVLLIVWIVVTLAMVRVLGLFSRTSNTRVLLPSGALLFLIAWMILDLRWSANSVRQMLQTIQFDWRVDEHQRLSNGLDGEIYRYIQRLKSDVLPEEPARILIVGEESAVEYFLQRAKYHLLPHSAYVARKLPAKLMPDKLDYVVYLGPPGTAWHAGWQDLLKRVDMEEWRHVYRVETVP